MHTGSLRKIGTEVLFGLVFLLMFPTIQTGVAHSATKIAIEDASVNSATPNTNEGAWVSLMIQFNTKTRWVYVKFSLAGITPGEIGTVALRLFCTWTPPGQGPRDVNVHKTSEGWSELTITWNTKLAKGNFLATASADGTTDEWVTWSSAELTDYVRSKAGGTVSFVMELDPAGAPGHKLFSARQCPHPPMLETTLLTDTQVVSTESAEWSLDSSLGVDPSGNIHVAWDDETNYANCGTDHDIFYRCYVPGTGWTITEVVSTESTRDSEEPSLAVDSSGNIHIAWQDLTNYTNCGIDHDIFYKKKAGGIWTTTEVVSTEATCSSNCPSLAIGSDGTIHIAWAEESNYAGSGSDSDIFYKKKAGGIWTITEVVSTESTGTSAVPSLAVDSYGNVHVAWHDYTDYAGSGTDYDIFYKRYVLGLGWTITEVVSTESTDSSWLPSLAVDPSGNIHVAWQDPTDYPATDYDNDIFYKKNIGGIWTITQVVSTVPDIASYRPSLAVDSSGNIHIAWEDGADYAGSGTDYDIFYKRYVLGLGWTITEVVSTESTDSSWLPSLAVDSSGNAHVAWSDCTDYAGSETDYDIFYKWSENTYDVTIYAYCYTEGRYVNVSITMDGSPTGQNTPYTFTYLAGTPTFTVPSTDPHGHLFKGWNTGETSRTITVTSAGTYIAYYGDVTPPVGGIWVPVDNLGLLAPYIGLASTILLATAATAIYVKHAKRREKKQ